MLLFRPVHDGKGSEWSFLVFYQALVLFDQPVPPMFVCIKDAKARHSFLINLIRLIATSSSLNRYWSPHLGIHRKIITQELQYHLRPQATVRQYTLEVSSP